MSEASWEHSYVALLLCLKTEPRIKNGTKIPPENIFVANSYLFYHSRALCNKANLLLNGQKPSSHWKNGEKIEKSRNRQVEIHSFSKLLATAASVTANQSYLAFSTIVASLLLFYLSF